ncbi:MAG TPA: class F sortase [Pseudonocardia sp.]|nr:class F sortase [Pseudonocardia sp.]
MVATSDPFAGAPSITAPSTTAPHRTTPSATAPPRTAPHITAPSTAVPSTAVPSTAAAATAAVPSPAAPIASATTPGGPRPVRLRIPAIGVDTGLITLGLQPDGSLEVPPDGTTAGWYTGSPPPGAPGPAVLAAHVDWKGTEGVFYNLSAVRPGDEVSVDRQDSSATRFAVTRVAQYPKDRFPTDDVYGDVDSPQLRLITCGGDFDHGARSYRDNIVVYAEPVH